jgi:hypothetical protein
LYYAWTALGLVLWISWVDDCLAVGNKEAVKQAKQQMMNHFDCDEIGELKEYVVCKVDIDKEKRSVTLTQPVLLQSFEDEFDLPDGAQPPKNASHRRRCAVERRRKISDADQGTEKVQIRCGEVAPYDALVKARNPEHSA